MNASEGLSRVAKLVRWAGWAIFIVVCLVVHLEDSSTPYWSRVLMATIGGGLPLIASYGVAWIIDGFAKPKNAPDGT